MANIRNSLLETVGNTPLVRVVKLNHTSAQVLAKMESFNPGGSSKDRVGISMIEDAEKKGLLKPGALIVEPTSGNTGIGLALAAAIKGYKLILTMPETMSIERRKLLAAYGAELVLTDGAKGMAESVKKAMEIVKAHPGSFMPQQFENPANAEAHRLTTGEEIWNDTDGKVDIFVASVGTGGTITGTAQSLRKHNPSVKIVAVEPSDSPLLSKGFAGPHKLQGIGANFIPGVLDRSLLDEIIAVSAENAGNTARSAATQEGMLIGISSGATLFAALQVAARPENAGKTIVALLPDSGERYLSSWLFGEDK